MNRNKPKLPVICFLCLLTLTLGGCREMNKEPSGALDGSGNYSSDISHSDNDNSTDDPQNSDISSDSSQTDPESSSDNSQSSSESSSDSQTESSHSQEEPSPEEQGVKGGIIRSARYDTGEYPNEMIDGGHGTQAELVRFRELIRSSELYTIDVYISNDWLYDKKMTDEQAQAIIDYYINAPISTIPADKLVNPSLGGSNVVKGYDKDGNFLFEANDSELFMVRFADGMMYDFYLDSPNAVRNILS